MEDRTLILLSCSRDKRDDGTSWSQKDQKITDRNCLPGEGTRLVAGRKWIFDRLKGEKPWLYSAQSGRGGKITRVYDLLSDSYYQSVFNWDRLASTGAQIYHHIFKADAGPDSLAKIATILVRRLDDISDGIPPKLGDWVRLTSARGSSFEFSFEKGWKTNTEAAREGLLLTERQVLDENRWLGSLPPKVLNQWILAEHAWRQVNGPDGCDFGASAVSFARAVEGFFRHEMKRDEASLRDILTWLSVSQFARVRLYHDLSELKDYRDRGAHSNGPPVGQSEAVRARGLALDILRRAVRAQL